jgi:GNAT acetyltransferase-like protein
VLGLELVLVGVYDDDDELIGLGPFYRRAILTAVGIRVCRLCLIGSAWRLAPTVRTEYCGMILPTGQENQVNEAILGFVGRLGWDEFVCTDAADGGMDQFLPHRWSSKKGLKLISRANDTGIRVDTQGSFDEWLSRLGKNTRLKAYNRRTYLTERGTLTFGPHEPSVDGDFFDCLNDFHRARWGKPVFDRDAVRFHRLFVERLPLCGGRAELTALRYNGQCVSVLHDVVVGRFRFNLQAGFAKDFDSKVSLGSLHLGFAVEAAFREKAVDFYDFLAGSGKTHFYKSHFQGEPVEFSTFQVVRSPMMALLYRLQSASPAPLSRLFNRRIGL